MLSIPLRPLGIAVTAALLAVFFFLFFRLCALSIPYQEWVGRQREKCKKRRKQQDASAAL